MSVSDSEVSDCEISPCDNYLDVSLESNYEAVKQIIEDRKSYTWSTVSSVPSGPGKKPINEQITQVLGPETSQNREFKIQERFLDSWSKLPGQEKDSVLTSAQQEISSILADHKDLFFLNKRTTDEEAQHRALYCLHAMQVAMTARNRILKNSQREDKDEDKCRDQGFTRAQTLIIVPFRNAAFDCISVMSQLWRARDRGNSSGYQVENYSRFVEEYGEAKPETEAEAESLAEARRRDNRPADFKQLFRGNIDDCFRIGIKFTRKSMKLFADFYSADVIIASPLGLRLVIDGAEKNLKSGGDWDFLSSIELLVVDQTEVISMQNLEHLERILKHINSIPKKAHGCDFSRVRSAFLDGNGRSIRQSLVFSRFAFPELNALLGNEEAFCNCSGAVKIQTRGAESMDNLRRLASAPQSPSFFLLPMKSEKTNLVDVMVASRFNFFCGKVIPALLRLLHAGHLTEGICIFIPSYFDFCQVRAHMKKARDDGLLPEFSILSEYCSNGEISRARSRFYNGISKIMLVTERFHFFRRYRIRGIRHLVFYGLPEFPEFFTDYLEMIGIVKPAVEGEEEQKPVRPRKLRALREGDLDIEVDDVPVMIAPLDCLKLDRLVGTDRARSLLEMQ